jgi:uncharacterized protein
MAFRDLPPAAAWRHLGARDGFEVVFLRSGPDGHRVDGHTSAVEEGAAWAVRYSIVLAPDWTTRSAHVIGQSATGARERRLDGDGAGAWRIDGAAAPELDGCLDVDLEASSFTNAFPVHRLGLAIGEDAEAPAAYVRATDLRVERLEQHYARIEDAGSRVRYDYSAPRFDYADRLVYDEHGLVLEYPGLALRAA